MYKCWVERVKHSFKLHFIYDCVCIGTVLGISDNSLAGPTVLWSQPALMHAQLV